MASIVQQTFTDWELLLMDDGSDDGALDSVENLADPRIRILRDGKKRGIAVRLNQALDLACGQYFARMDADDVSFPDRFAKQVEVLQADGALDLVATRAIVIDEEHRITGTCQSAISHEAICARPWLGFPLPHPTWMGRTAWFRAHRYATPAPYLCEDQELLLRTHAHSKFGTVDELLFAYRIQTTKDRRILPKIRRATAQYQLRYFLGREQWYCAALALLAWPANNANDWRKTMSRRSPFVNTYDVAPRVRQQWADILDAVTGSAPPRSVSDG
ncbi:hypothetical protein ASF44_21100 [Pseudorhodoferax sp. Leaf274]|nr:hypothetical protein ASF44_21100 [Pseudorhodoferax sp. Leaf274]